MALTTYEKSIIGSVVELEFGSLHETASLSDLKKLASGIRESVKSSDMSNNDFFTFVEIFNNPKKVIRTVEGNNRDQKIDKPTVGEVREYLLKCINSIIIEQTNKLNISPLDIGWDYDELSSHVRNAKDYYDEVQVLPLGEKEELQKRLSELRDYEQKNQITLNKLERFKKNDLDLKEEIERQNPQNRQKVESNLDTLLKANKQLEEIKREAKETQQNIKRDIKFIELQLQVIELQEQLVLRRQRSTNLQNFERNTVYTSNPLGGRRHSFTIATQSREGI